MTFKKILDDFSVDEAWKHLEWLNQHAPAREPGSDGQKFAAEYIAEQLQSFGIEARLDSFTAYYDTSKEASLHLESPQKQEFKSQPCAHTAATEDEGVVGDLVMGEAPVAGCVVLAHVGKGPPPWQAARTAAESGAIGIVFVAGASPEPTTIPLLSVKNSWGNPTRTAARESPRIPAVTISAKSGKTLVDMLDGEKPRVRLVTRPQQQWGPLSQPIGRLKVPANVSGDFLLLGSHFDAVAPGMTSNAAGTALVLELARVFAHNRESLQRDIFVGFWNGQSTGAAEGATWFADRYWDHLDQHAIAYINAESVGLIETSTYVADSTPELSKWHRRLAQQILGERIRHRNLGRGNEQPFFGLGLSALEGRFHFTEEQAAQWGGARRGWWWHTEHDTVDKVDRDRFGNTAHLYARYVWDMCTLPVLPMDFTSSATRIDKAVSAMQKRAKDRFELDLPTAHFVLATTKLLAATKHARDDTKVLALNRTLLKLGRILTPAFDTAGGRYEQDHRSHEALSSPLPAVYAMQLLATAPFGEDLSHQIYTELLRQRNRLSDALRWATSEIHDALDT